MNKIRYSRGSAITETGPALLILVLTFFPLLDLLGMAVGYQMASTYHDRMARELAVRLPDATGWLAAKNLVNNEFIGSSFYNFLRMQPNNLQVANPTYTMDPQRPQYRRSVRVQTTVTVQPFLTIPFIGNVPGLSGPMAFTINSDRPQEEQGAQFN